MGQYSRQTRQVRVQEFQEAAKKMKRGCDSSSERTALFSFRPTGWLTEGPSPKTNVGQTVASSELIESYRGVSVQIKKIEWKKKSMWMPVELNPLGLDWSQTLRTQIGKWGWGGLLRVNVRKSKPTSQHNRASTFTEISCTNTINQTAEEPQWRKWARIALKGGGRAAISRVLSSAQVYKWLPAPTVHSENHFILFKRPRN